MKLPDLVNGLPKLRKPYVPKGPKIPLRKSWAYKPKKRPPRPTVVQPWSATIKSLETNFFAKMLASRAKMDAQTHLVAPKMLWNKVGCDGLAFKPINPFSVTKGPRVYLSPAVAELSPQCMAPLNKKPTSQKYSPTKTFLADLEQVDHSALQQLLANYTPMGEIILYTNGQKHGAVPSIVSRLNIPDEITIGENNSGVLLAGFVYRQWYISTHRMT